MNANTPNVDLSIDEQYVNLLHTILYGKDSYKYADIKRNNEICHQVSTYQLVHDMRNSFPLLQVKKVNMTHILNELLWFLRGESNILSLNENGCTIWNDDTRNFRNLKMQPHDEFEYSEKEYEHAIQEALSLMGDDRMFDAGDIYGVKWRSWRGITADEHIECVDQFESIIYLLNTVPFSRRALVSAWDAVSIKKENSALPPCHWAFEVIPFNNEDGTIGFDLKWHQRSVDTFLGLPFNIASYGALMLIIEALTGYTPRYLIGDLSNVHIYDSHVPSVIKLLDRELMPNDTKVQLIKALPHIYDVETLYAEDFVITDYNPQGFVGAKMLAITNPNWQEDAVKEQKKSSLNLVK